MAGGMVSCARCGVEGERGEQPGEGRIVHGGGEPRLAPHANDLLCDDCADELEAAHAVTDDQIRNLRHEAGTTQDYMQVAICNLALGQTVTGEPVEEGEDYSGGGWSREEERRLAAMTQEEARLACAEAIRAARSAREGQ